MYLSEDQGLRTIGISIEVKVRDILLELGVLSLLAVSFIAGIRM